MKGNESSFNWESMSLTQLSLKKNQVLAENVKFFLEGAGYLAGEVLGSFIEAVDGPVDFDDSEQREKFWTRIAPTMSRIIQRKLAQNNIKISLKSSFLYDIPIFPCRDPTEGKCC